MMRVWLGACVFLSLVLVAACGPKVPQHGGYKTKSPWKKAKPITLTDGAGNAKGSLDYADYKRAKWYTVDLPEDGDLNLNLSFEPTDAAGDATVAMEVLDANYHVISEDPDAPLKAAKDADDGDDGEDDAEEEDDEDEDDDGGESDNMQKAREIPALHPGRYYIHLFVTKRLDAADYKLAVSYIPVATTPKTDFPRDVAWVPALPTVPVADDAPDTKKDEPPPPKKCKGKKCPKKPKPDKPDPEPETTGGKQAVYADIVAVDGDDTGATITINVGTADGVDAGRKGSLKGVKNGSFSLSSCSAHACKAHLKASAEEIKHSSMSVKLP